MNRSTERPHALIILDGWGFSQKAAGNAIAAAHTPNYDRIMQDFPWTTLAASGPGVGLEQGKAGNPEVGHMHIGGGRTVRPMSGVISDAIASGAFFENEVLRSAMEAALQRGAAVHLVGMISDTDVHASTQHLYALLQAAKRAGHSQAFVHGILDGRDMPARSADTYVEAVEVKMAEIGVGRFASLCGRYFGMDNAENWDRTARAFTMLAFAEGERAADAASAIRNSFLRGISEEFMSPVILESEPGQAAQVRSGDLVVFFNHRADTMRQLVRALAVPDQGNVSPAGKPWIESVCLTEYDAAFCMPVAFPPRAERNTLAEVLAANEISNLRVTETDRVPHVVRFFNCGSPGGGQFERSIEIASPQTALRESEPEMQSFKITDRVLRAMEAGVANLYIVNIPAAGLVAETGDTARTLESVRYVDTCLGAIVDKICELGGSALVTSSYANCEEMLDAEGKTDRFPTANPVPLHLVGDVRCGSLREGGTLADVAPTLLGLLGLPTPAEMTGVDLRDQD